MPEDVQQVYDYVTTCINQISKDGLVILGAQGGYINIPPIIDRTHTAYIPNDPAGISKTPLWYYEGEDRTPSIEFMTRELAFYIKQELPLCTGNFEAFKERFDITASTDLLPIVTLTDQDVIVEIKWPLDIGIRDKRIKLEEFVTSFPVKLKQMWELADKTLQTENSKEWFENLTIDLMSANQDIPMSGMEFKCGTKRWHILKVKEELQKMLYYNLPFIRVDNTNYPAPLESLRVYNNLKSQAEDIKEDLIAEKQPDWPENPPSDVYEMNRMRINVDAPETDLKAAFQYIPEWPLLINAQPSSGGTLSTADMKGARKYLRFLCLQQWHFTYDVIYPVKMTIKDDGAFNGEGYTFQMGFPVVIEDNEGSRQYFGLRKFQTADIGTEFCSIVGAQAVDIRVTGFVEGSPMAEELEGANITYRCLNKECLLGSTFSDGSGSIRLNAYLPEGCSNPLLTAQKEGYLPAGQHATSDKVDIMLTKLQRMNYTILVHPYIPINKQWLPTYRKFTRDQHATVSFSIRKPAHDQYKGYPANATALTGTYTGYEDIEKDELDFVFGDAQYDLDILLLKGDKIIGGYHAENITISYDEIAGASAATFNVVEWRGALDTGFDPVPMFLYLYEDGLYDGLPYQTVLRPTFR